MPKEEELAIITLVRDFAEHELSPVLSKFDDQPASGYPSGLMRQVEDLGLTFITAPEECGGTGLDISVAGLAIEELAAICPGFAVMVASSLLGMAPLFIADDMEKARGLVQMLTNGDGSSHHAAVILPDTGRTITINAVPDGAGFRLNGPLPLVILGGTARLYTTFASLGEEMICCAIPGDSPGLIFSDPVKRLGLNVVPCCDVILENVHIPAEYVLASSEKANAVLTGVETQRHGIIGAAAVGSTRAALREAAAYALDRHQGGQAIAQHHAVATLLTDIAVGLESARAIVNDSLICPQELRKALLARIYATDVACTTAINAVQVFGGYGYMRDLPVEKLMRDSQQLALIGGSNGWLRVYINNHLQK